MLVFNIKKDEDGGRKLKSRLVVHGNKDNEKDDVRTDAIATGMMETRLVMDIGVMIKFKFGVADIRGDFMQREPAHRAIYIVP